MPKGHSFVEIEKQFDDAMATVSSLYELMWNSEVGSDFRHATIQKIGRGGLISAKQAEKALKTTFLEAKLFKSDAISTAHLLLCILRNENDPTTKVLHNFDVFYEDVKEVFQELFAGSKEEDITESPVAETPPEDFNEPKKNPYQFHKDCVLV